MTIEDPCTDGQRYTLGRDGLIVIKADGNKFFTGSCVVTLRAEDSHYQCSKLCFTVDSFKLQVCDLRLAFYDTGVWNYGAAPASWVRYGSKKLWLLVEKLHRVVIARLYITATYGTIINVQWWEMTISGSGSIPISFSLEKWQNMEMAFSYLLLLFGIKCPFR